MFLIQEEVHVFFLKSENKSVVCCNLPFTQLSCKIFFCNSSQFCVKFLVLVVGR